MTIRRSILVHRTSLGLELWGLTARYVARYKRRGSRYVLRGLLGLAYVVAGLPRR